MEAEFTIEEVIALMKKTKKTDPLFKPLKKLKTALESIGLAAISFLPTKRVLVFHFGLGNEVDREFLKATTPAKLSENIAIIPGHAYCILNFTDVEAVEEYMNSKNKLQDRPVFYSEINYQNLSRILMFFYCREDFLRQNEVFPIADCPARYDPTSVPGLIMVEDILTKEEQAELLGKIDQGNWQKLNNRRVQHHGYEFKYGRNQIDKDDKQGEIPDFFKPLLDKLEAIDILKGLTFDQLTINDYFAGNGIPPHFDTHSPFEEVFISVSLLSSLVMDFRKYDGEERLVYLKDRSVAIFSGEARYAWIHGISSRKVDKVGGQVLYRSRRVSLTFRKIRRTPCNCPYYFFCDSQGYDQEKMKKNNPLLTKYLSIQHTKQLQSLTPPQIQRQFVDNAYNGFGFDFHNRVIEQAKTYMQKEIESTDIVLDLGCGNGQYRNYTHPESYYIGIEKCTVMVPVENELHMDCLKLAFRNSTMDKVLFVAVLHHFASEETRVKALRQARRVMKQDGVLYLTVLSYENKRDIYASPETFLEYCLPANKKEIREQNSKLVDMQKPKCEIRGEIYKRYYHLFTVEQIRGLFVKAGLEIMQLQVSSENIIIKATKRPEQ